jgi:hypothetical protein
MLSSECASSAQQERLVLLLHFADVEPGAENEERGLSLATIVHECLHSANFWEQENIRCEVTFPNWFSDLADLGSIIFCCSTRQNRIPGCDRCREITQEFEEACIWPRHRESGVGSRENIYFPPLSAGRVYSKGLSERFPSESCGTRLSPWFSS